MTLAPLRAGLLIALFALTLFVRESADRLRPSPPATTFDVPPIPTDVARPLSFGFASVGADLAFLEAAFAELHLEHTLVDRFLTPEHQR